MTEQDLAALLDGVIPPELLRIPDGQELYNTPDLGEAGGFVSECAG